jgi:hypothetical protein
MKSPILDSKFLQISYQAQDKLGLIHKNIFHAVMYVFPVKAQGIKIIKNVKSG